jgi:hypothetical protein
MAINLSFIKKDFFGAERIVSVQFFLKDESGFCKYQFNFTHHMRHILLGSIRQLSTIHRALEFT